MPGTILIHGELLSGLDGMVESESVELRASFHCFELIWMLAQLEIFATIVAKYKYRAPAVTVRPASGHRQIY
jgi:hypothetical protein